MFALHKPFFEVMAIEGKTFSISNITSRKQMQTYGQLLEFTPYDEAIVFEC